MRWILLTLMSLLQAAPLPSAYPRPGTTKLFENARVLVWDISWLKQQYPLHRHPSDLTGVYYTDGDRIIVSEKGEHRPVHTKAWETAYQLMGVTHIEEGASDPPLRAVFVEMKEPSASGVADTATTPAAFPAATGKQLRDNERSILWEFVPPPVPGAHRHLRDAVVITFTGQKPAVSFVSRGTVHDAEGARGADRLYVIELK
jgi:hypothetical protein